MIIVHLKPDIVHFEWASYAIPYLPILKTFNLKFFVSARGSIFSVKALTNQEFKDKLRPVMLQTEKIVCVSKEMEKVVWKLYPETKNKTIVIYNGVDTQTFKCKCNSKYSKEFNIVWVGNLVWIKSIDTALFIFKKFLEQGGHGKLHVIGDGPDKRRVLFTAKDLEIEKYIKLHGKLSEEEISLLLQEADVLLHTAYAYGIPNVVYEAMATCTIPVVTMTFKEDLKYLKIPFLYTFPPLDTEKGISILFELYKKNEELKQEKCNLQNFINQYFAIDIMERKYKEFYLKHAL